MIYYTIIFLVRDFPDGDCGIDSPAFFLLITPISVLEVIEDGKVVFLGSLIAPSVFDLRPSLRTLEGDGGTALLSGNSFERRPFLAGF